MHIHIRRCVLKIYTYPLTVNGLKMSLIKNYLNIEPEIKFVNLFNGEQKSKSFLELNPNGQIPVVKNGNTVIYESNAIMFYLASKYQSNLWPESIEQQSQVLQWLFWQGNQWGSAVMPYAQERVLRPFWGIKANDTPVEKLDQKFHAVAEIFDSSLCGKTTLIAESFTLADLSISSFLIFSDEAKIPLQKYENINRWLDNIKQQPWWIKTKSEITHFLNN